MALKFLPEQFEAFAAPARGAWVANAALRVHQAYPDYFTAIGVTAPDLEPICEDVERWAATHHITGSRDTLKLCFVAITFGHGFWRDPRFKQYVGNSVGDPGIARARAVQMLVDTASDWLRVLWQGDALSEYANRMAGYIKGNAEPDPNNLKVILPGHWELFDSIANERLIAGLISRLPATHMAAQRLAYVAGALVHGTGWVRDPQYVRLKRIVETAGSPADLADSVCAFYGRIG